LPVPSLPGDAELVDTHRRDDGRVVFDGIDPRFDHSVIELLQGVVTGERGLVFVSHLSRLSRNMDNLLRILEIILASGVPVLTTNMMLRPGHVWPRRWEAFVPPVSTDPMVGLHEQTGLAGSHRRVVSAAIETLSDQSLSASPAES
jgi:hypothetical protein